MSFSKDVWSLLRRNISTGQLIGYAAANVVGLTVVLVGVLFYTDSQHSGDSNDAFFGNDYVVMSKPVEGVGFDPAFFTEEEIADIASQPWTRKVGRFTSSQFTVNGQVNMGGRGLGTYLFFESVPDEFFDIKPRDWKFDPAEGFVPIILNKDYLALYNFGFAVPQGLPQLSEEVIGAVPIALRLYGDRGSLPVTMEAAIVGFSSRLNTIAVPQSFMDWANRTFAPQETPRPSRLIVEVDRMAATAMNDYLRTHGLEVSGADEQGGNISTFLGVVSGVVATNGLIICALALFILILSIFLMLQKSRTTLRHLMLLGYAPSDICRYYWTVVIGANAIIAAISAIVTFAVRPLWNAPLRDLGLGDGSVWPTLLVLATYLLIVTAIDVCVVRRHMLRIWHN